MEKKGCVYFFKHVGLSPVKIGYSNNESPLKRFESFKTYAPYGAELIGFITTIEAKNLETLLHQKFSSKRLRGEWFELTNDEIKQNIDLYTSIEQVNEMNDFMLSYAKSKYIKFSSLIFKTSPDSEYNVIKVLGKKELQNILKIEEYEEFLKSNVSIYKAHRVGKNIKKGYLLYFKA